MPAPASAADGLSPATRRTAWIVSAIFFIEQLEATILAPALPAMAADLGTDPVSLSVAITAYLIGLTVLIPLSGRLADRYGDKRIFLWAIAWFLLASLACGFATDSTALVLLRFAQGLAGALMAPVGRLIVLRTAARHEIVEAMALVILLAMIAPMVGPFLGGLITSTLGWRWIFWSQVPLCLAALLVVWRLLPATRAPAPAAPLDLPGAALTGAGFAALVYGLALLARPEAGADAGGATAVIVLGLLCLAAYGWHARRALAPVLALGLLRLRSFRDAMLGGSVFRIAVGGVPFLLPLTLQTRDGYSPFAAGLLVLIPAVGGFTMKFYSTRLLRRFGYRRSLGLHGCLAAGALAVAGLVSPRDALWLYAMALFVFGWARSLQMNAYGTLAYADIEPARLASATSFFLSVQNLTVALGVALTAALLRHFESLPGNPGADAHPWTYAALAVLVIVSAALSLVLPVSAGSQLLARAAKSQP